MVNNSKLKCPSSNLCPWSNFRLSRHNKSAKKHVIYVTFLALRPNETQTRCFHSGTVCLFCRLNTDEREGLVLEHDQLNTGPAQKTWYRDCLSDRKINTKASGGYEVLVPAQYISVYLYKPNLVAHYTHTRPTNNVGSNAPQKSPSTCLRTT